MGHRLRPFYGSLTLLLIAACHCSKPVTSPPPDSAPLAPDAQPPAPEADPSAAPPGTDPAVYGAMDPYAQACAVLSSLKCPEATPTCAAEMKKLVLELHSFEAKNVTCIRQSRTVERVRFCAVDCKR